MDEILEILEKNSRISPEEIARMLKRSATSVKKTIKKLEKQGVILGYKTIINKELMRQDDSEVRAIIEVRVTPQKDLGFDKIAQRIYSFPEVKSCYLLSGTYDLLLVVEGRNAATSQFGQNHLEISKVALPAHRQEADEHDSQAADQRARHHPPLSAPGKVEHK